MKATRKERALRGFIAAIMLLNYFPGVARAAMSDISVAAQDADGFRRTSYLPTEKALFRVQVTNNAVSTGRIQFSFEVKREGVRTFSQTGNSAPASVTGQAQSILIVPVSRFFTTPGKYTVTGTAELDGQTLTATSQEITIGSPTTIQLTYPSDRATGVPIPRFTWTSPARRFRISISDDPLFLRTAKNLIVRDDLTQPSFEYTAAGPDDKGKLLSGTQFYWKVDALDPANLNTPLASSSVQSFTLSGNNVVTQTARKLVATKVELLSNGAAYLARVTVENQGGQTIQGANLSLTLNGHSNLMMPAGQDASLTVPATKPGNTGQRDFMVPAAYVAGETSVPVTVILSNTDNDNPRDNAFNTAVAVPAGASTTVTNKPTPTWSAKIAVADAAMLALSLNEVLNSNAPVVPGEDYYVMAFPSCKANGADLTGKKFKLKVTAQGVALTETASSDFECSDQPPAQLTDIKYLGTFKVPASATAIGLSAVVLESPSGAALVPAMQAVTKMLSVKAASTDLAKLAMADFSPASGKAGDTITITGAKFTGLTAVKFGAVAASFTFVSDDKITATVPATAATGAISVTTPGGTVSSGTRLFTVVKPPTISSFSPSSAKAGALVAISGRNLSSVTDVSFDGVSASPITVVSATSIKVAVPAGAPTGKISVTNPAGSVTSTSKFTALDAPSTATKPSFATQPAVSGTPTQTTATVTFKVRGTGDNVRVMAVKSGAAAPAAADVIAGKGGVGTASAKAAATGADQTALVTGLTAGTSYDFYAALETGALLSTKVTATTAAPGTLQQTGVLTLGAFGDKGVSLVGSMTVAGAADSMPVGGTVALTIVRGPVAAGLDGSTIATTTVKDTHRATFTRIPFLLPRSGTYVLKATIGELSAPEWTRTVPSFPPSKVEFVSPPTTLTSGQALGGLRVKVTDFQGDPVNGANVQLSFYQPPSGSATITGTSRGTTANGEATWPAAKVSGSGTGLTLRATAGGVHADATVSVTAPPSAEPPSLAACIATPSLPGCSAVLPSLAACIATPTLPGCNVVLPSLAACVATPTLSGCNVVLPSLATCTATPTLPGCSAVLPATKASDIKLAITCVKASGYLEDPGERRNGPLRGNVTVKSYTNQAYKVGTDVVIELKSPISGWGKYSETPTIGANQELDVPFEFPISDKSGKAEIGARLKWMNGTLIQEVVIPFVTSYHSSISIKQCPIEAPSTTASDKPSAAKLSFTTQPAVSGTPTETAIAVTFKLSGTTDDVRVMAVKRGATTPTAASVMAGTGGVGKAPAAAAATGADQSVTVTGLEPGTAYDIYAALATSGVVSNKLTATTAALKLVFTTPPSGAEPATAFTTSPVVVFQKADGTTDTSKTLTVTLAIKSGTGTTGATLTATPLAASAGVATFTDVKIDKAGTGYVLTASATGLTPADSPAFDVSGGAPSITSFTPPNGKAGTTVTITGTSFSGATSVKFGAVSASFTVKSADTITVAVPSTGPSGRISVRTPKGTGTSVDTFTAIRPPTISSFTPPSGKAGTTISIIGRNLSSASSVSVNGVDAGPITVISATSLTVNLPATATTGKISVTNPAGSVTSVGTFTALPSAAPAAVGAAAKLAYKTPPSGAAPGVLFTQQPVVEVQDANGNVVTTYTGSVRLAIRSGTGSGGAKLTATTKAAVAGVATFSDVKIDKAGTGYVLMASAVGLTSADSASFAVGGASPATTVYSWSPGAWGKCSATCGGGTQARTVTCVSGDGSVVSDSFCTGVKPASSQACNTQPCSEGSGSLSQSGKVFTTQPAVSGSATQTSVTLTFKVGGAGNNFRVIAVPHGAAAPTAADILAGTGGIGTAPAKTVATGADQTATVNGLSAGTTYDFYAALENGNVVSAKLSAATAGATTTAGFTAQPAESGTPTETSITVSYTVSTSENVRVAAYTTASRPSAANVLAGTGAAVTPPAAQAATAGSSTSQTLTGLTPGTQYTIYAALASGVVSNGLTATTADALPSLAACIAESTLPGCSAVLPSLTTCITAPATPGCSAVLPTVAACTATPTLPGCSAVLPSLTACIAAPTTPGCSAVLPSLAACTATPTLPGCSAVLPAIARFTVQPAVSGTQTADSLTVSYTVSATENVRVAAYTTGSPAPTAAQVNSAKGTGFVAAGTAASATGGTSETQMVSGLTPGTAYDIYAALETSAVLSDKLSATTAATVPTKLAFTTQPSGATAGQSFLTQPVVTVQGANGATATGFSGQVALSIKTFGTDGAVLGPAEKRTVNAVHGVATFSGLSIDKAGTAYTLEVLSGTLTAAVSASFNVEAVSTRNSIFGVPGLYHSETASRDSASSSTVNLSPGATDLVRGETRQFTASVISDPAGKILWTTTGGTITQAGLYTAPNNVGVFKVKAQALSDSKKFAEVQITVGSVVIELTPGVAQMFTSGTARFSASVKGLGNPGLTWTTSGGTVTDGVYTAPATAGTYTVRAAATADTTKFVEATVTVNAPAATATATATATKLAFTTQPSGATAKEAFTQQPVVTVQDASGNKVAENTATVTLAIKSATGATGAELTGTSSLAAVAGVATFSGLGIDTTGTGYVITASATGLTSANSEAFAVAGGSAEAACPTITLSPSTLANQVSGRNFSVTISATGSTATPYKFTVTAGALPTGATLNSETGVLSGAASAGTYNFTITSTDANGCSGSKAYTLTITCTSILLTPTATNLLAGTRLVSYSTTGTASNGVAPYTYSITAGTLQTGLSLNKDTGVISGAPAAAGTATFTLTATDAGGCTGSRSYSLKICSAAISLGAITTTGRLNGLYSQSITATGGTAPYTFVVVSGTVPSGSSLSSNGVLSGTLKAQGTYTFTARATDSQGCSGTRTYTITVQ